jgi:hypothetical protein
MYLLPKLARISKLPPVYLYTADAPRTSKLPRSLKMPRTLMLPLCFCAVDVASNPKVAGLQLYFRCCLELSNCLCTASVDSEMLRMAECESLGLTKSFVEGDRLY